MLYFIKCMILMNCASEYILIFICPAFTKLITVNGQEYHLQVVDTAGQVLVWVQYLQIAQIFVDVPEELGYDQMGSVFLVLPSSLTHIIVIRRLQWLGGWSCTCWSPTSLPSCLFPFLSPVPLFPGRPLLNMNI